MLYASFVRVHPAETLPVNVVATQGLLDVSSNISYLVADGVNDCVVELGEVPQLAVRSRVYAAGAITGRKQRSAGGWEAHAHE